MYFSLINYLQKYISVHCLRFIDKLILSFECFIELCSLCTMFFFFFMTSNKKWYDIALIDILYVVHLDAYESFAF